MNQKRKRAPAMRSPERERKEASSRPLMSRRKDSPHARELFKEMQENEAENFQDDTVTSYPDARYQDTPAREEALLKSIYADRDTRTFAEMSIADDTPYSGGRMSATNR